MVHPWLKFDPEKEIERICELLRNTLIDFKRRGYVLGVSGGIDSSMTLGLCVKAIGPERVLVLQMPERHSADETLRLSALIADHFGVRKRHRNRLNMLFGEILHSFHVIHGEHPILVGPPGHEKTGRSR